MFWFSFCWRHSYGPFSTAQQIVPTDHNLQFGPCRSLKSKHCWYLLKHFVLHGSFLLKIYTYIPKLMYFQILLKDFVRNVHLEDVWANTDGPLLFTCFGGRRKCGVWWAIMPWFQEPARWELKASDIHSRLSWQIEGSNTVGIESVRFISRIRLNI